MTRTRTLYLLIPAIIGGAMLVSSVTRADDDPWASAGADAMGMGSLSIASTPPAEIFIDGQPLGMRTPARDVKLAAGRHVVTLFNKAKGIKTTISVQIKAGEHVKLARDLTSHDGDEVSALLEGTFADHARHAADLARSQIERARQRIARDTNIPPAMRDKISRKLDKAARTLDKKLGKLQFKGDWEQFGEDMGELGEQLGEAFADMGDDFEGMGDQLEKQIEAQVRAGLGRKGIQIDITPGGDPRVLVIPPIPPVDPFSGRGGAAIDMSDLDLAIDLDDLALSAAQRHQLQAVIQAERAATRPAQDQLDHLSDKLRDELADDDVDQAQVDRYVDEMTAREAVIRKARLRAWADSKRLMTDRQRQQVEASGRRGRRGGP